MVCTITWGPLCSCVPDTVYTMARTFYPSSVDLVEWDRDNLYRPASFQHSSGLQVYHLRSTDSVRHSLLNLRLKLYFFRSVRWSLARWERWWHRRRMGTWTEQTTVFFANIWQPQCSADPAIDWPRKINGKVETWQICSSELIQTSWASSCGFLHPTALSRTSSRSDFATLWRKLQRLAAVEYRRDCNLAWYWSSWESRKQRIQRNYNISTNL